MTDGQKSRLNYVEKNFPRLASKFRKAFEGNSKSAAIKAKCLDCCGYQRAEVAACTAEHCPLWPYRPYQTKEDVDE